MSSPTPLRTRRPPHPRRHHHGTGCLAVFLTLATLAAPGSGQLLFLMEPPPRLAFSNSSGARVSCAAHGNPPPLITWLADDGSPLTEITGLRGALPNGTLWLGTFSAAQYRSDVHATVYRCRAANSVGTVLSRDMRVDAVMDVEWEVRVEGAHAVPGGAALLTCAVPAAVRAHVAVTRWFKDGAVLGTGPADSGGRWVVAGGRGSTLLVRELRAARDELATYACEAQHALTGEKRRSPPAGITLAESTSSLPPRLLPAPTEEVVSQGADIRLVCCAVGQPAPAYSWYYESERGDRATAVASGIRVSVLEQVVAIRRAQPGDAGTWSCRAHNRLGEQRHRVRLIVLARLTVHLHPQLQIANSGSVVTFNCSVGGADGEGAGGAVGVRVRWLHDGTPVGGGERVLRVHGVARAHRGMYQCIAERDGENAQASAELRLGDTAPELHYTFIEQALHPGPALALHCAASGSPPPRFTWLLDNQPLEQHNTPQRSVTQYTSVNGDAVSYLNLSSVRAEDGGRYTCRAHNSRGSVEHSTRLNVYGPPSIRNVGPVRVVAGSNATVYCPFSGFPISEIRWQRGGTEVGGGGAGAAGAGRAAAGGAGELLLWPAETADAGLYSCRVTSPSGQYAQKDIQIMVKQPPKIAPFMFPTDLIEGSSAQILCGLNAGDKPIYFSWLKDGQPFSSNLQIQEKSLDEFSLLMFTGVTSAHSGDYTCIASNAAAEVNYTARLTVRVAPSWLYEPQDVSALLGTQVLVHCATKGYPEPTITWLKGQGASVGDFRPVSPLELQHSVLANGSLSIAPAARRHEGQYLCRADNGVGRGLAKIIRVSVNEPAHFEYSSRNMTTKRMAALSMPCDALGDPPIQIQWTHDLKRVDLTTYRVSVSEVKTESGVRSQLSIAHAERRDSGAYRCRAENAYGRDELLIYLAVQEYPESPRGVRVAWRHARGARLVWRRGYDGNARVRTYRLQYRVVGEQSSRLQPPGRDDWNNAPTRDLPADHVIERPAEGSQGVDESTLLEYKIEGLRPATAYALRLAAVNAIGESEYSDPVIVKTLEEAPSEPPHSVQVQATTPGELLVKWKAPAQESWNGELLGYVVSWREASAPENASRALSAAGWGAGEAVLPALRTHAHYEVRVRAFNAIGAGPPSPPLTATTLEGVPEAAPLHVRCEPLSAQSVRLWWEPPPAELRGGILLGYEVLYEAVGGELPAAAGAGVGAGTWGGRAADVRRVGGLETTLHGLQRAANYSLAVRARTAAGAGAASPSVHCATLEDVPGAPADVKAIASSEESVLVSWLPPLQRNGKIKYYTVYSRPAGRIGQHTQQTVPAAAAAGAVGAGGGEEYAGEVRGLQEHQLYEFWVTAATASGEGELSSIIARKPNSRAGARVASFGRRVWVPGGGRARLRCTAAGRPAPLRVWTRARPSPPLAADPRFHIDERGDLLILSVERGVSDNYTCAVRNPWGDDSATWEVRALFPPARPTLRLTGAAAARLHLAWDAPADGGSPIHSYTIYHARSEEDSGISVWSSARVPGDVRAHTLERLACGARYRVRLVAHNAVGAGPDSNQLLAGTKGGPSKAAPEKELISSNSSCVRLNLLTWESHGCPVEEFSVSVRAFDDYSWREIRAQPSAEPLAVCGLNPGTWFHLLVLATTAASTTRANYYFSTLTELGERVAAPVEFPPAEGGAAGGGTATAVGAAAALALVAALMIIAVFAWRRRGPAYSCFRKGYVQGDISEDEDNKSLEKRDNHRNCQQVYTSSPIKLPPGKKEQQEMYEISPYATFSMAGGAGGGAGAGAESEAGAGSAAGAAGAVQFRTFGRADEMALAAPARPQLDHTHKHRSFNKPDEYTLSRAMTLMVTRREDSDTDSSGSPCTECNSNISYRQPVGGGKGEVFRPITDSSAESQLETCSLSARAHDKSRRRARKHHTPTSARYQQRQEQERRDFTIHV